jgi:rsbT co-antagonist protein RsbR
MNNPPLLDPSTWRSFELLQRIVDTLPDPIFVKDRAHRWIVINEGFCKLIGHPYEALIGKSDFDFWPPEQAAVFWSYDDIVFSSGEANENEELATGADGVERTIWTRKYPMLDAEGQVIGLCGIVTDITRMRQRLVDSERLDAVNREQVAIIEAQRALLETLAVPVIRVWEGVLLLPLVGALNRERAALVTASVLDAIGRARARFLLIDVTGVPLVDTMAAEALLRTVRAATLLGCESVLVGVGAAAAQTLVGLDIDLGRIATRATLDRGIEYALGRLSYRIVKVKSPIESGPIS